MLRFEIYDKNQKVDEKTQKSIEEFIFLCEKSSKALEMELKSKINNLGFKVNFLSKEKLPNNLSGLIKLLGCRIKYFLTDLDFGPFDRLLRKIRIWKALSFVDTQNKVLLDVGCGRQASVGWKFKDKLSRYVGIDRDIPCVQIQNVTLIESSAEQMLEHIKESSVDVIIALAVLEHLKKPQDFIKDCQKVLKKGGQLVITTPPPNSKDILELLSKLNIINGDEIDEHENYFTKKALEDLLNNSELQLTYYKKFLFGFNSILVAKKV